MTFLYFAFGSNMLSNRLIARCPSAKLVGKAFVQDHALEFTKKSVDGSGKATLIERTGVITPGVLFEIETAERDALGMRLVAGCLHREAVRARRAEL